MGTLHWVKKRMRIFLWSLLPFPLNVVWKRRRFDVRFLYNIKQCSDQAKAKIFFDVCHLLFDLFRLFFDLFRFRSMWVDLNRALVEWSRHK